ncbi:MAG: hypothetical protein ACRD09_04055, partial [Vicinamibacterales bacterium]
GGQARRRLVPPSSHQGDDMSLREIPAAEWPEFLENFTRGHRAWLATVDRGLPGAPGHIEVFERPLRSVTPDVSAGRVIGIEIRFQEDSGEAIRIDAPASVRVEETMEGAARVLEIHDKGGECTRIRFRAVQLPEMLDGVAPGELPSR